MFLGKFPEINLTLMFLGKLPKINLTFLGKSPKIIKLMFLGNLQQHFWENRNFDICLKVPLTADFQTILKFYIFPKNTKLKYHHVPGHLYLFCFGAKSSIL